MEKDKKKMINISERSEDLKYREDMEKYLEQHPDRNIALEQIMKIENGL